MYNSLKVFYYYFYFFWRSR